MIQTSEGNLPQGLDTAIRTGLEPCAWHWCWACLPEG